MTAQARMIDGMPVVTDATARDAWWPSASRPINARVHRLDTNTIERWTGSVWTSDFAGAVATEAWVNPTLLNSWVNVSGYQCSYYKRRDGIVMLRTGVQSGATGQPAFTLPVGYRPQQGMVAPVWGGTLNFGAAGSLPCFVSISTNGNVTPFIFGTSVAVSLDIQIPTF